jgi:capsular polysaccharide biosynthesis protein
MATSSDARPWAILSITAGTLVVLAALAAWFFVPVQYEAYALLKVANRPPAVLTGPAATAGEDFSIFKRTQAQLLLSSAVLEGTLRDPQIDRLAIVQAHQDDPVSWLRNQLEVNYPDDAEIMRVTLRGSRPDELPIIVDKVVDVFLREVVEHEKQMRLDGEEKLRRAYEKQSADYQKELNALRTLESIHKTSGSEAAQLKRKLALEELDSLRSRRREVERQIEQNELEMLMSKVRAEEPAETRTADPPVAARIFQGEMPLKWLERKEVYLTEKLVTLDDSVRKMTDDVAGLESFSAQVAAKQEELNQLRLIKNQLGAELDRIQIERLAPDRIVKIDDAVIASNRGDAACRNLAVALAAAVGLALMAVGAVILLPNR